MALPALPSLDKVLPQLATPDLISISIPGIPGASVNIGGGAAPVTLGTGINTPAGQAIQAAGCAPYAIFCMAEDQLLRLLLMTLGLILVIGAIYLYKPTHNLVSAPLDKVKSALADAPVAAAAA